MQLKVGQTLVSTVDVTTWSWCAAPATTWRSPVAAPSWRMQEDVIIVGLSILSGAHVGLTQKTALALRRPGRATSPLVVDGTLPQLDVPTLQAGGAAPVLPTGTPLEDVVERLLALTARVPARS